MSHKYDSTESEDDQFCPLTFSCCFHEDNEDQDRAECPKDPSLQSLILNIFQAGHGIHQQDLSLHLRTGLEIAKNRNTITDFNTLIQTYCTSTVIGIICN